jgi:3-hydroxyisobutyrate dehydrogenase
VDRGATLAASPAACIAADSNLVIISLLTNDTVRESLSFPGALDAVAGKTIVNLTNGTPAQARELDKLVTAHGGEYIHGGVMATPSMIGTPACIILYSGPEAPFKRVELDLALLGTCKFLSGTDAGMASLHDVAMLTGMYGLISGFLHAVALARSSGLMSATDFTQNLLTPFLSGTIPFLPMLAAQIDQGTYDSFGDTLAMQVAAIPNLVDTTRDAGVWPGMLDPLHGLMKRRVAAGGGAESLSGLIEEMGLEKN